MYLLLNCVNIRRFGKNNLLFAHTVAHIVRIFTRFRLSCAERRRLALRPSAPRPETLSNPTKMESYD